LGFFGNTIKMKKISYLLFFICLSAYAQKWQYESTTNGKIALPSKSNQQTAALVFDIDKDGKDDLIVGCRVVGPALIWFKKTDKGWERKVIENDFLTIEAGGTHHDIDGDGDEDIVFGGDWQTNKVWWWENPYPNYTTNWKRYEIKSEGKTQHHDQVFGDFKHVGTKQLVFWNQAIKTLFIAEKNAEGWKYQPIFTGSAGESDSWYAEGLAASDVDGDGWDDLIGGNYWFKYEKETFKPIKIGEAGGRVIVGKFKPGRVKQIVISPGDGKGRLMLYEWTGKEGIDNPAQPALWKGRDLLGREMIHSHSLELGDVNNDGFLDIFTAEMTKWSEKDDLADNPNSEAIILYGDGSGNFRKEIFKKGWGFHEAKLGDFDGDGDLDIASKPYAWKTPRLDVWLQNGSKEQIDLKKVTHNKIALEIYSFRNELQKDLKGTLRKIKEMGFNEIEIPSYYGLSATDFVKETKNVGLKITGALFGYNRFEKEVDQLIKEAKILGVRQIGCGWIDHEGDVFTKDQASRAIAVFNAAGAKLKKAGIRFYYHTHGYEFVPTGDGKTTLFDYMASKMIPGVADFQLDVYWAHHGGENPTQLLKKYKGRFLSLHLKDMAHGQEHGVYKGWSPVENDCIHGQGQQNFQTILKAAIQAGVSHFYIEDENLNAMNQVPKSLIYLRGLK
jgi:sugar phosphate isomerase/epimerase